MIDVKKTASLARLAITQDEEKLYAKQMESIIGYFEALSQVPTEGVEPMVSPTPMVQHLRADEAQHWEKGEVAIHNAPELAGQLFKVPPVV